MIAAGWIDEVKRLKDGGVTEAAPAMRAIGYSYILRHLEGKMSAVELFRSIVTDTQQYAKRQETWMRSEPRLEPVRMEVGMSNALGFVLTKLASWEIGRNQVVDGKSNQSSGHVPESSA
jgi:tRNA dimethylallyltransferase